MEKMKKTAFIFMEFQNDFFKSGKLPVFDENSHFVKNAEKILDYARGKNSPVVHVHLSFSSTFEELREDIDGVLALVKKAGAFENNGEGAKAIGPFIPQEQECCLYKNGISAFERTGLEEKLDGMEVTDVVFVGLLSNVCIESSVRDAYDKGYRVFVVNDATSTLDEAGHQHAMKNILPLFSTVCTTETLLQE
jgi:nicotinamidase-related amidase